VLKLRIQGDISPLSHVVIVKHRGNFSFTVFVYLCFRRLKRWILEKQQKGVQGTRRYRHKSVGDVETNLPKNKRQQQQQQFTQAIQVGSSPAEDVAESIKKVSNFRGVFWSFPMNVSSNER
jgi:hypothetical protein